MDPITIEWLPEDYMDEWSPPPRAQPSDWIGEARGDGWMMAPPGEPFSIEPAFVQPGDTVRFYKIEDFGSVTLRSGDPVPTELPPDAILYIEPDPDTICDSYEDMVALLSEYYPEDLASRDGVDVRVVRTSTLKTFRLAVSDDGPRFVEVEEAFPAPTPDPSR